MKTFLAEGLSASMLLSCLPTAALAQSVAQAVPVVQGAGVIAPLVPQNQISGLSLPMVIETPGLRDLSGQRAISAGLLPESKVPVSAAFLTGSGLKASRLPVLGVGQEIKGIVPGGSGTGLVRGLSQEKQKSGAVVSIFSGLKQNVARFGTAGLGLVFDGVKAGLDASGVSEHGNNSLSAGSGLSSQERLLLPAPASQSALLLSAPAAEPALPEVEHLKDLVFQPLPEKTADVLPQSGQAAGVRPRDSVRKSISEAYYSFLKKTIEADKNGSGGYFDGALSALASLRGQEGAQLASRLYDAAKKDYFRNDPMPLKKLGFALMDAGYVEQGRYMLEVHTALVMRIASVFGGFGNVPLLELAVELSEHGQKDLARRSYRALLQKIDAAEVEHRKHLLGSYEYKGTLQEQGKKLLEEFLSSRSIYSHVTPEEFHEQVLALPQGLYEFNKDEKEPSTWLEKHYLADVRDNGKVAGSLRESLEKVRKADPFLAQEMEARIAVLQDAALRAVPKHLGFVIKDWERDFSLTYKGDIQAFVSDAEKAPDVNTTESLESILLSGYGDLRWGYREELLSRKLAFLDAIPVGMEKLSAYEKLSEQLRPEDSDADVLRFVQDWDKALNAAGPGLAEDFYARFEHFGGLEQRMRAIQGAFSEAAEQVETSLLGAPLDVAPALRKFFMKFGSEDLQKEVQGMPDDKLRGIMSGIIRGTAENIAKSSEEDSGEKVRPEVEAVYSLMQRAMQQDVADVLAVQKALLRALPFSAVDLISYVVATMNSFYEMYAEMKGLDAKSFRIHSSRPSFPESALYMEQQARMARVLLSRKSPRLRAFGRAKLLGLAEGVDMVLSPRDYTTKSDKVFGDHGGSIHTLSKHSPAATKFNALVEAAYVSSKDAPLLLREAERLLPDLELPSAKGKAFEAEVLLYPRMRLMNLYAERGETQKAESLYRAIESSLMQGLPEQQRLWDAEKAAGDKTYWGGAEDGVKLLSFMLQDLRSRQRAAILARSGRGSDSIGEFISSLNEGKGFSPESLAAAASILETVPGAQVQAVALYGMAVERFSSMPKEEEHLSREGLDWFVGKIEQSRLSEGAKDELLAQLAAHWSRTVDAEEWLQHLSWSGSASESWMSRVIKGHRFPKAEAELLKTLERLVGQTQFKGEDFYDDDTLKSLALIKDAADAR
ncbi:MAG: hypothetical protein WCU88_03335 [Elusimicrobiota bacterium]|jgi:hypothetical protein